MTNRRKFLAGLGALASGSAAAVGTGAFTSASAERSVDVAVSDDTNAFLGLQQVPGSENSADYTSSSGGTLTLFEPDAVAGSGFNLDGRTRVENLFRIANQSSQDQYVWLDLVNGDTPYQDEFGNDVGERAVGFFVTGDDASQTTGLQSISFGSAPEDPDTEDRSYPAGEKAPADTQPLNSIGGIPNVADAVDATYIPAGSSVDVGVIIDTRGNMYVDQDDDGTDDDDPNDMIAPGDLISEVVVKAQAETPGPYS